MPPHLVAASTKTSSSSSMAMKPMPSEPWAQPSSRTSMPLCSRYARIASCDLSSMLFPMAVCPLVLGPAPLANLVGRMAPAGKRRRKGGSETRMRLEFPKGRLRRSGKFSRPLCGSVCGRVCAPKARRGGGVRGGCPWECADAVAAGLACLCARVCAMEA